MGDFTAILRYNTRGVSGRNVEVGVAATMLAGLREGQPPLPLSPDASLRVAPGVDLVEDELGGGAVWLHGMVWACWDANDEAGRRLAAVTLGLVTRLSRAQTR